MSNKGALITFEGLDGSGKSTQLTLLELYFKQRGIDYVATKEPGGTDVGNAIRRIIMSPPEDLDPLCEALLFAADRAQHFATKILPALNEGKVVISDRCYDSSIVYQGFVNNIGIAYIEELSIVAMRGRIPDLTVLLDLPPEAVHQRRSNTGEISRFDAKSIEFHNEIRRAFIAQANAHTQRIKVIDATKYVQQVHQEIIAALMTKFPLIMQNTQEETKIGCWFDKENDE